VHELLGRHGFDVHEFHRVHMLPLTTGGPADVVWKASRALERVPASSSITQSSGTVNSR
jgi:hypothetical protein